MPDFTQYALIIVSSLGLLVTGLVSIDIVRTGKRVRHHLRSQGLEPIHVRRKFGSFHEFGDHTFDVRYRTPDGTVAEGLAKASRSQGVLLVPFEKTLSKRKGTKGEPLRAENERLRAELQRARQGR